MRTVRSCRLARFMRAAWDRKSTARDQSALVLRIRDLAHARPRFSFARIAVQLRREGGGELQARPAAQPAAGTAASDAGAAT